MNSEIYLKDVQYSLHNWKEIGGKIHKPNFYVTYGIMTEELRFTDDEFRSHYAT